MKFTKSIAKSISKFMKEFGSDFHYIIDDCDGNNSLHLSNDMNYYACGRHAINALILDRKWKRIWMPEYFCYTVIESIKRTNIDVVFYKDSPISDDISVINTLSFEDGDVLFRMNYFGLRVKRDNTNISIPVIEDHSHSLFCDWSINSNADYCIASLRKTLPLTEGGVLWSPKDLPLPRKVKSTINNDLLASEKLSAMLLKKLYLDGSDISKDCFRDLYVKSETMLDESLISGISKNAMDILGKIDTASWVKNKGRNWALLFEKLNNKFSVICSEEGSCDSPFSLVLMFDDKNKREIFRSKIIDNNIYPAILWDIPNCQSKEIVDLSNRLLSIHCDGRYDDRAIIHMCDLLKKM